jgi:hypothetical protein
LNAPILDEMVQQMSKNGRIWSAEGGFGAIEGGKWAFLGELCVRDMITVAGGVPVDGFTKCK